MKRSLVCEVERHSVQRTCAIDHDSVIQIVPLLKVERGALLVPRPLGPRARTSMMHSMLSFWAYEAREVAPTEISEATTLPVLREA
jgi:hypothetical protein